MSNHNDDSTTKWQRSYKACISCRNKKMKCDMGPLDNPHGPPCMRCKRERKECVLPENKKRRDKSVKPGRSENRLKKKVNNKDDYNTIKHVRRDIRGVPAIDLFDPKWKFEIGTMYNSLEYLAKAAGTVAKEEQGPKVLQQPVGLSVEASPDEHPNGLISDYKGPSDESFLAPFMRSNGSQRASGPLIEKLSSMRPKFSRKLTDIEYIGPSKLLSEDEAIRLIDIFFLTMYPFFPHIPLQLQDPDELVRYPILLCAILTIAARYNPFGELGLYDNDNRNRNIEVHERLWIYCQRLISQTIWAEASTRSIGTVLAFLLFTEWNPRAIHWKWSDYANNLDLNDVSRRETSGGGTVKEGECFTGMAAIRRSDRMAWMLTGTAVRLAQDMGFIDTSCKILVAAHISEAHTAMNLNQRSILSESLSEVNSSILEQEDDIGNESFYLEHLMQTDESKERWTNFLQTMSEGRRARGAGPLRDIEREFLNDEYVLYYVDARNDGLQKSSSTLPFPLRFSETQRAKIELLRILTIGYESMYHDRQKLKGHMQNGPRRILAQLEIISLLIERWYASYRRLLVLGRGTHCNLESCRNKRAMLELSEQVDKESLCCEYNYCQLYIYSSALQGDAKRTELSMAEISKSARYVELAYKSAKEILNSAERIRGLRMLGYMPIRWVTRIMRSVAFIVKCYMTLTQDGMAANPVASTILRLTVIPSEEIIGTIERAASTLEEAAPDDLHLGVRYAKILMYLCTEIKLRSQMGEQEVDMQQQASTGNKSRQSASSPSPSALLGTTSAESITNADTCNEQTELPYGDPFDWFAASSDMGLDFVDSWTEMIENRYMQDELGNLGASNNGSV